MSAELIRIDFKRRRVVERKPLGESSPPCKFKDLMGWATADMLELEKEGYQIDGAAIVVPGPPAAGPAILDLAAMEGQEDEDFAERLLILLQRASNKMLLSVPEGCDDFDE